MSAADIFRDIKGDHRFYLCLSLINDLMWSLRYMIGLRTSMAVKAHKPHFHTVLSQRKLRDTGVGVCSPRAIALQVGEQRSSRAGMGFLERDPTLSYGPFMLHESGSRSSSPA